MGLSQVNAPVMSSADSFLNAATVSVINDITNPLRRIPLADRTGLWRARITTSVTGSVAVVFALKIRSLLDILNNGGSYIPYDFPIFS